jgi:ribonuclease HI
MNPPKPHFLLICEGNYPATEHSMAGSQRTRGGSSASVWRFELENVATGEKFEATDKEASCAPDRAALVAVLRGLEALEQPSRVTLMTSSRYVFRGLRYGLTEWRENNFSWEHFGSVQPIRNADLWKRIDRTLGYHQVQCRWLPKSNPSERTDAPAKSTPEIAHVHPQPIATVTSTAATRIYTDAAPLLHTTVATTGTVHCDRSQTTCIGLPKPHVLPASSEITSKRTLRTILFFPVAIAWSLAKRSLQSLWNSVLRLDEGIESYLRCMLLLDPKHRHHR